MVNYCGGQPGQPAMFFPAPFTAKSCRRRFPRGRHGKRPAHLARQRLLYRPLALAKDSVVDGSGTKKVAIGAATVLALRIGLRYALGGPLGLVLTVAASASLVSYFFRHQKDIVRKVSLYKKVIQETRGRYDELQAGWRDGRYDATERNLMIDGLMKRFVQQIDEG